MSRMTRLLAWGVFLLLVLLLAGWLLGGLFAPAAPATPAPAAPA